MKKLLATLALASLAGGGAFLASQPREGCGARCCRRPTPEADCLRRNPHSGIPEDFGYATMPGTHAVGSGCVPTECVLGQGIEPLEGH